MLDVAAAAKKGNLLSGDLWGDFSWILNVFQAGGKKIKGLPTRLFGGAENVRVLNLKM